MRTRIVLAGLAIGASAIGIGVAPLAAGDPSNNCQTTGASTVCAQGSGGAAGQSATPGVPAPSAGGGCKNSFGIYQNCNVH